MTSFRRARAAGSRTESTPVLDLDVVVENGFACGVHVGDKPVLVELDSHLLKIESCPYRSFWVAQPSLAEIRLRVLDDGI